MSLLAEASAHTPGEPDAALTEFVPEFVRRGQGLLPALMAASIEQIEL